MERVLVRGAGDIGSAVAHRLFAAGYAVVLHEESRPTTTRRGMAFADAVFAGEAQLEGVAARRVDDLAAVDGMLADHEAIPLSIADVAQVLASRHPTVFVDARMRKRAHPEDQRALAPLTIGLGPNFVAGGNVHIAIETSWEDVGRVITDGSTLPLAGEPRVVGGHRRDRYIYAPVAGLFHTARAIGDMVEAGEVVASIDSTPLLAPLRGVLRGLTHEGVPVTLKVKVIEVDPRGDVAGVRGIGERPRRIADGVLTAVQHGQAS